MFFDEDPWIRCLQVVDGIELTQINIELLFPNVAGTQVGSSPMTMGGPDTDPVMVIGLKTVDDVQQNDSALILSLDLLPKTIRWSRPTGNSSNISNGQYPIIQDNFGDHVVVFTSHTKAARFLRHKP